MSLCRYDTSKPCNNNGTSSRTCIDCILNKIRAEVQSNRDDWIKGLDPEWHAYDRCLGIIDKYRKEQETWEENK